MSKMNISWNTGVGCDGKTNKGKFAASVMGCIEGTGNLFRLKGSNVQCDFKGEGDRNDVEAEGAVQVEFFGDQNKVRCTDEVQSTINGNFNNYILTGNTKSELLGNNNTVNLTGNAMTEMKGNSNSVNATGNVNLQISGDRNQIDSISNSVNHKLKILEAGDTRNKVNIDCECKNWTTSIEYAGRATIDGKQYKLGIFQFQMEQYDDGRAKSSFDPVNYDSGTLSATQESRSKVTVTGSKYGNEETLTFSAAKVSHSERDGHGFVYMNDAFKT